ncbi:hypothetical protein [Halomonas cerina]|uniref:Uncharacterized protein n=1 Tax=Halomonas cerina TaxID=447424 RepID=A0A839V8V3_9GAMM|nr:hypothetical protein [Halomonas cerina]MBB3191862.1 hypothetical protein [Halomonas cerina]
MRKAGKRRQLSGEEIGSQLEANLKEADNRRYQGLDQLARLEQAKQAQRRRERKRLMAKYGSDSPKVRRLEAKLDAGEDLITGARVERQRLDITASSEVATQEWVLKGFLRGLDGEGLRGVTLVLSWDQNRVDEPVALTRSHSDGSFEFRRKLGGDLEGEAGLGEAEEETQEQQEQQEQLAEPQPLWLHVLDPEGKVVVTDSEAVWPTSGVLDYRDLTVDPAKVGGGEAQTRYLGNASTLELHDLENSKPQCRVDTIRAAFRKPYKTQKAAVADGFDFCAYCFGREKSKW